MAAPMTISANITNKWVSSFRYASWVVWNGRLLKCQRVLADLSVMDSNGTTDGGAHGSP